MCAESSVRYISILNLIVFPTDMIFSTTFEEFHAAMHSTVHIVTSVLPIIVTALANHIAHFPGLPGRTDKIKHNMWFADCGGS